MARVRSPNRAVPVLGGVALALMILATMIGNVQAQQGAQSVCDRCISIAWAKQTDGRTNALLITPRPVMGASTNM